MMKHAAVMTAVAIFVTSACSDLPGTSFKPGNDRMPTPIETVTAFSAAISKDNGRTAIRRWFTPETVWVNEGVATTRGIEEAIAFLDRPGRSPEIAAVHFDMLAIAVDGNSVLTERLDRFVRADGSEVAAIKLMGIFEVDGDHIVAWRDYADVNAGAKIARKRE